MNILNSFKYKQLNKSFSFFISIHEQKIEFQ